MDDQLQSTNDTAGNDKTAPKMGSLSTTFAAVRFTRKEEGLILRFTQTHDEDYRLRRAALIRINATLRSCFMDPVLNNQNVDALNKKGRDWLSNTMHEKAAGKSMMDLLMSGELAAITLVEEAATAYKVALEQARNPGNGPSVKAPRNTMN